jgi:hypothetical protein
MATDPRGMTGKDLVREYTEAVMTGGDPKAALTELLRRLSAGNSQAEKVQISNRHIERKTEMRDGKTYCACGDPWPCSKAEPKRSDGQTGKPTLADAVEMCDFRLQDHDGPCKLGRSVREEACYMTPTCPCSTHRAAARRST